MMSCLLIKYLCRTILAQLLLSLALPEHGVLPPVEPLDRVHVASLSHVPEHVPQALQVDHVPSTERLIHVLFCVFKKLCTSILEQDPISFGLPEHGLVPPAKLLVRLHVASLSHVPEQVPHAFHVAHVPSTVIRASKVISTLAYG